MSTPVPHPADRKKNRLLWVDAVKGGGILLVLIAHTNLAKAGENPYPDLILQCLTYFMACYMPLFFVISGYTFKDKPGILRRRAIQLLLPYAGWALLYYALFLATSIFRGEIHPLYWCRMLAGSIYSRIDLFTSGAGHSLQLFPKGCEPLWFLTCLFCSYALYLPIHRAGPRIRAALVAAYTGATLLVHHSPILFPWSLDTAFAGALFIYAGHLLAASQILNKLSAKALLCAAVILPIYVWAVKSNGGSGGMYCREFGRLGWYAPVVFIVMGICGSYLWCIFCQILEKLRIVRLLSAIGEHTLLLLCSHMFIYLIVSMLAAACFSMWPTMQKLAPFVFIIQLFAALSFAFMWSRIKKRIAHKASAG